MTEAKARAILMDRMGNDYWFLPVDSEAEWVKRIQAGTFFSTNDNHASTSTQVETEA